MEDGTNHDPFGKALDTAYRVLAQPLRGEVPPLLWHYTSLAGAKGIAESLVLRAGHFQEMNDPTEGQLLVDRARSAIAIPEPRREANGWSDPDDWCDDHSVWRWLQGLALWGFDGATGFEAFLCSFSAKMDDLSQWRAYGDDGRGVALGFETARLDRRSPACGWHPARLVPVTYDADVAVAALRRGWEVLREHHLPIIRTSDPVHEREKAIAVAAGDLRMLLLILAHLHKGEGWRAEHEWRLLCLIRDPKTLPEGPVYERAGPPLRHHVELPYGKSIRQIWTGPAAAPGARLTMRLAWSGMSDWVRFHASQIPYRTSSR